MYQGTVRVRYHGTEVGISLGDIVLDADPAPLSLKGHSPQFSAVVRCGQTAGWITMHAIWYGGRLRPRRLHVQWDPASPQKKGHSPNQFLAHVYCGQTAGWMKTPLDTEVDRPHC